MSGSVGSVSVEVVPDARGWSAKLQSQLRDQKVEIKADADTAEAEAQLDEAARTRTAKIKADTSEFSKGANALEGFVERLGLVPALAIAGTAALIPLAGALAGVAAALAAPLVVAAGGATLFGFLGLFAVKNTQAQLKNIDSLQKKLAGLTKGTAEYASTQQELAEAQKALSPQQVAFANSLDHLKGTFASFIAGPNGQALLEPFTQGLNILSGLLPKLSPVVRAASGAFSDLLGGIGRAASSPGFDRFMHMIAGSVGHDIRGFGEIAGNLAKGLGGLFAVLDRKAGGSLVDQLVRLSGAFSDWANSKAGRQAVQDFLDYFHRIGPGVADAIAAVARATEKLVSALAPLGPGVLKGIQLAAEGLAKIPAPVLTGTAAGVLGLTVFGKAGGFKRTSFLANKLTGGQGIAGGLIGGGIQKVYVVNWGEGPGGGGGGGYWSKAGKWITGTTAAGEGGTAAGLSAAELSGIAAPIALALYGAYLYNKDNPTPYGPKAPQDPNVARGGPAALKHYGYTPPSTPARNSSPYSRGYFPVHDPATGDPQLKSTATLLDVVSAHAAAASRQVDLFHGRLSSLPNNKVVKFIADAEQALGQVQSVKSALAGIERVVNVHINVTRTTNALLADVNTEPPRQVRRLRSLGRMESCQGLPRGGTRLS